MSKFDKLFEAREESVKEDPVPAPKKTQDKTRSATPKKTLPPQSLGTNSNSDAGSDSDSTPAVTPQIRNKQRGRPKAKRSNPDYLGFTTYIRKDTHLNVKILLLQEGKGREMSELVEELLSGWIKKR